MEIMFLKGAGGVLIPMDEDEEAKLERYKTGDVIKVSVAAMRNGRFFRKWWALAKLGFDMFTERTEPMTYMGMEVQHNFDSFRRRLVTLAGYYTPVYNLDGTFILEPHSISFASMNEETFEKLYSETINDILKNIAPNMSERDIRRSVDAILSFA